MSAATRIIAHLDMDAFYASVELLRYPELHGRPVVVGGGRRHQPEEVIDPSTGATTRRFATLARYAGRGVATTASYEARKLGVHSAMGLMKAAKLAPDAILLPSDFDAYREQSRRFKAAVRAIAPEIEDRGIDEIYIDLTEVVSSPGRGFDREAIVPVARAIKRAVKDATELSCSIGIAPNKLLAKIASDLEKPDGLVILDASDVPARIWPLAARKINGIGPKASARLAGMGIESIGQLAQADLGLLGDRFGRNTAHWMHEVAHGRDERSVVIESETKSISRETTFDRDLHAVRDRAALSTIFTELCEQLAGQRYHVSAALTQRRQGKVQEIQPVVKILAKRARSREFLQRAVAGGDETHIHGNLPRAAQPSDRPSLDCGEQLGLGGRAQSADLVEEKRASVGGFAKSDAGLFRIGEGTALMAEQLGFGERFWQGRTIQNNERLAGARAGAVQPAGEQAFAGARLSLDEHWRQMVFQAALHDSDGIQLGANFIEAGAEKDAVRRRNGFRRAVLFAAVDASQAAAAGEGEGQFRGFKRLGKIIPRAKAHRFHRRLHSAERRHHDHHGVLRKCPVAQQLQTFAIGEMQVQQRELKPQLAQQTAGLRNAAGLSHLGSELAQIAGESLAEGCIVFEQ